MAQYGAERRERRAKISARKKNRRVEVGPFACFYFESYDTMLHQVHEMLFIERGGEEQIAGELDAYNTLVPDGAELVATLESDQDRTTEDGKTSAVHFLHFPLTANQIAAFKQPGAKAVLAIGHHNYAHMATIPETVRVELAQDFD